ncbi:Serine/threonine-protein kinase PrkC [Posidoniimonas corsicana]|uniref:non-specific serine/threonine protein kinase n=1 Tax=Posidoniimonas corsicana TaxID=1938618 RepID=A0A5C5UXM0_9BACT|nr:serine/threonine-protein kinase [Posidoniimonas corsicana]TWT30393.1 Serine/threonine-protein kinase PrkC [Posidoniimonas corsicana]
MVEHTENREPIELLAERFLEDRRQGRRVTIEDYAAAHPDQADEIRDLFPTIVALEEAKSGGRDDAPKRFDCPDRLGDLRILGEIGRGGMGVVYEAEQESLGRRVAVKVLPGRALFDTRQLERFRREARTAAALQHPNIVPIYSVGEQDGLHYLVMQRIDGVGLDVLTRQVGRQTRSGALASASSVSLAGDETLAAHTVRGLEDGVAAAMEVDRWTLDGPSSGHPPDSRANEAPTVEFTEDPSLSGAVRAGSLGRSLIDDHRVDVNALDPAYYDSVAKIGAQAADALAYAHGRGALHRDIKPANLLLDRTGRVWVTDFGLAKMMDQDGMSRTGELLGTLRYMSPEQLRGEATARSDLYALGLTLYELVTFRSPFEAPTPSQVLQMINEHQPERPRKLNPKLPVDLEKIILKAMAADPADRYATGEEMAADLRRFLDNQPVTITRAAFGARVSRWLTANRVAVVATAAALLGAAAVFAVGALLGPPPRPPEGAAEVETPPIEEDFEPRGQGRRGRGLPPVDGLPPRFGPPGERRGPPHDDWRGEDRRGDFGPRRGSGPPPGEGRRGEGRRGDGPRGERSRDDGPRGDGPPDDFDGRPLGERFGPGSPQGQARRDFLFEQRRRRQQELDRIEQEQAQQDGPELPPAPPDQP